MNQWEMEQQIRSEFGQDLSSQIGDVFVLGKDPIITAPIEALADNGLIPRRLANALINAGFHILKHVLNCKINTIEALPGIGVGGTTDLLIFLKNNIPKEELQLWPLINGNAIPREEGLDYSNIDYLDVRSLRIHDLISVRLGNTLIKNKLYLIKDVLGITRSRLAKYPHFGFVSLEELDYFLNLLVPDSDKKLYKYFLDDEEEKMHVPDSLKNQSILSLGLSKRATNSLLRGQYYSLGDLDGQSRSRIVSRCRGMGTKCISEIFDSNIIEDYVSRMTLAQLPPEEQLKSAKYISDFVREGFSDTFFDMFMEKYQFENNTIHIKYKISRQAISLKINKVLAGIKDGFKTNRIAPFIYSSVMDKVSHCCPLDEKHDFDPVLSNRAVIRIFCSIFPGSIDTYRHACIRRVWAFNRSNNIGAMIHKAREYLAEVTYCTKEELMSATGMSGELIDDIIFIHHYGSFVSTITQEKYFDVFFYTREHASEVFTVKDIADEYGLDEKYVRNTLLRIPNVVNVGLSKYAMVSEADNNQPYKTLDIIVDLLKKAGKPLYRDYLVNEVLKKRDINRSSVIQAIYQNGDLLMDIDDNKVALTKWGYKPKEIDHNEYETKVEDAVLAVLKSSFFPMTIKDIAKEINDRFGSNASDNVVSIHSALQKLKQKYPLVQSMHGQEASYFLDDDFEK